MVILKAHYPRRAGAALAALALVGLAACSGSGTSPKPVTQANIASNVLQLAVGTANIYGDLTASGGNLVGTNIVATYRQTGAYAGTSVLVDSPSLTGPFTLTGAAGAEGADPTSTILTGPSGAELGGHSITSTPQGLTAPVTTLGSSGGVSGLGIEPFNYNNVNGVPFTVVPYQVPVYDPLGSGDPNSFIPWGGPPAFDPNHDGEGERDGSVIPSGVIGVSEGLDVFADLAPVVGAYTLNAPSTGTSAGTVAPPPATFTLKSTALLAAVTPPIPTMDGAGGATFAVTLPPGVTQAYLQVTDLAPTSAPAATCNGGAYPVYYTIFVTASGTVTLGDNSGPGTPAAPTPSICTSAQNTAANGAATDGDNFTVQLIGFDYPAYAASYPNSLGNPAPALVGGRGQDDITISSAALYAQPGGVLTLQSRARLKAIHSQLLRLRR